MASVANVETYGLLPDIQDEQAKALALKAFSMMYGGTEGKDAVAQFLGQTGLNALKGADILRTAPAKYSSTVEYASTPIAESLKSIAQVICADLGTQVYYAQHGSFDTHAAEIDSHAKLWKDVSEAIGDFTDDLREHGREDDVMVLVMDNGTGTDHGSGSAALVIGGPVQGGMYGEYPSLKIADQTEGDLRFTTDFRSTYSTILEQWFGLDAVPIVNGTFEQLDFVRR